MLFFYQFNVTKCRGLRTQLIVFVVHFMHGTSLGKCLFPGDKFPVNGIEILYMYSTLQQGYVLSCV